MTRKDTERPDILGGAFPEAEPRVSTGDTVKDFLDEVEDLERRGIIGITSDDMKQTMPEGSRSVREIQTIAGADNNVESSVIRLPLSERLSPTLSGRPDLEIVQGSSDGTTKRSVQEFIAHIIERF